MTTSRDADYWARPIDKLNVEWTVADAINRNVNGRRTAGPLQGFGQLWQKSYRLRLVGSTATPEEVVQRWKERLPLYQPADNRFFPSLAGVVPGEVVLINATLCAMPVLTGVRVIYSAADEFTLMTPEGHPECGWITFGAYADQDGCVVAQIQSIARAGDVFFEVGFRLGAARLQEKVWVRVLEALASDFDVLTQDVAVTRTCVDGRVQWSEMHNVWQNAAIRSVVYKLLRPLRRLSTA
jgi:hypothetical protein